MHGSALRRWSAFYASSLPELPLNFDAIIYISAVFRGRHHAVRDLFSASSRDATGYAHGDDLRFS